MRPLVLALYLAVSLARGASPASLPEVVSALGGAEGAIFVGSYLRDRQLAEAMRRLVADRKGTLVLVTSPYTYLDGRSYFLGLYLAGASLYLGPVEEYYLVIDNAVAFKGRGLGAKGEVARLEGREVEEALEAVRRVVSKSYPFSYGAESIVLHFWR